MHPAPPVLVAGAVALLLAGCGSYGGDAAPTWVPSPSRVNGGAQASPIVPLPSTGGVRGGAPGGGAAGPSGSGGASSSGGSTDRRIDPNVVATHLTAPVGIAMLPDGTALVGERTTGRIVRVQPRPGQPVPTVRTLHGLDPTGDGGLLDLAISPGYAEDGLIYAYLTTATDNRVVDFTLHGPVTPVFTGIPKGRTGNTGRIAFGSDGNLYIGTGDAGRPKLAAKPQSLAGKVLRLDDIGDPAAGNPNPPSPVWTSGHEVVNGLCPIPRTRWLLEVEQGATDEVNLLSPGASYGFPAPTPDSERPAATLPDAFRAPGGCAVLDGRLWVTSLDGESLLYAQLRATSSMPAVGRLTAVLKQRYGRLLTVVAAADGALWLTTANRDGHGSPVAADERVIRYLPPASPGGSPV